MSLEKYFNRNLDYLTVFFFGDPGLGTLWGGLGLIFWGLCFPSFVYFLVRGTKLVLIPSLLNTPDWWASEGEQYKKRRDWFYVFFIGQLFFGLFALYSYAGSEALLGRSQRLVLFVSGLGLVILAMVWSKISPWFSGIDTFLKVFCILASLLTLFKLGAIYEPVLDLRKPLMDRINLVKSSPYKYTYLGKVWEPLDLLTQSTEGLDIYVAGPKSSFFTWPIYGTKIQNNIWNFDNSYSTEPDAFFFHTRKKDLRILFVGPRFTPEDVMLNPSFFLVSQDKNSLLFFNRSFLNKPQFLRTLLEYYQGISQSLMPIARYLAEELEPEGVFLTSSDLGYSFRYLELSGEIKQRVVFAPLGGEVKTAKNLESNFLYTFGRPLPGMKAETVMSIPLDKGEFRVFRNEIKKSGIKNKEG